MYLISHHGIISLKPFPNIIRNGMQCSELSVFNKSTVEYVQDIPQSTIGGTYANKFLPPLRVNNEYVQKAVRGMERFEEMKRNNVKVDLTKYGMHTVYYDPVTQTTSPHPIEMQHETPVKPRNKTRRKARRVTIPAKNRNL